MLTAMDHRYIDELAMAERYVGNTLEPEERAAFEAHLVDCQECTDRVLLAEMFHTRQSESLPLRARLAARLKPWHMLMILAITLMLLVAVPGLLIPVFIHFITLRSQ